MSAELEPFRFQSTHDVSQLQNFLVSSRNLTPGELAVYNKARYDYARLSAREHTQIYAQGSAGRLTEYMVSVLGITASRVWDYVDGLEDSRVSDIVGPFAQRALNMLEHNLGGTYMSGGQGQQAILQEQYPEPPVQRRPNFWDRLLGRA
jgi:hypothetical protein